MTRPPSTHRGFTLVEMVTSLAILAILLLACGSMLHMALKATGNGATTAAAQAKVADAAAQIVDDLNVATNFTQRTAKAVTFTVPDRLNAGTPQTVKYSWSGGVGAPLLRQFNGGTAATVLPSVTSLNFDFATRAAGTIAPTLQSLFDHQTTSGTLKDYDITNTKWAAQVFTPNLPLGTSSYSITRVRAMLKVKSQDGVLLVSIRQATVLGAPTSTVICDTVFYAAALSNQFEWVDIPITGATNLAPGQNICVVFGYASGGTPVCTLKYDQGLLTILSGANWTTSSDAGASWAALSTLSTAEMAVYGTVP